MRHDEIVNETLEALTKEFIANPYLCYTEQGLHAMFFCMLFNRLPLEERYEQLGDKKVSVIQKEYPTFHKLKDSRRGHWDIAVLERPLISMKFPAYDFLKVNSAVEFGLNESIRHLKEDIKRLTAIESNVPNKFLAHFYRLSESESQRDWNPRSKRIVTHEEVSERVKGTDIIAFYALVDQVHNLRRAYRIKSAGTEKLVSMP
jgi:hypothetical protein